MNLRQMEYLLAIVETKIFPELQSVVIFRSLA